MKSIKEIYKIGPGPSSSHTLAVERACLLYQKHFPAATYFQVSLFDSLSLTAEGHHTLEIIEKSFYPQPVEIFLKKKWIYDYATGMEIVGFNQDKESLTKWEVASVGGGSIKVLGQDFGFEDEIYPHNNFDEVKVYLKENKLSLFDYVLQFEPDIKDYMNDIVSQMLKTVATGLNREGLLPGRLNVSRVSKDLLIKAKNLSDPTERRRLSLVAYAYGASEENASGGHCVTAPTLGASGVLASIVYHYYYNLSFQREKIIEGLCVAGVFANVIKKNATLAGSEGGCQAEIGSAVAMGAAFICYLNNLSIQAIEYAAEIGIEHHLGLTCDPVGGYVIIPCIERNANGVLRAFDAAMLAEQLSGVRKNKITFDSVVSTMNYTGKMIIPELRETSLGGLAAVVTFDSED